MASSNIKLFDENKGNMLTDTEFSISNQRMNGLQTGVASSQLQNKAMYQASLIAYAIAQIMMQNGKNANDTDAVSAFVANLSGTMLQKVYDIATTEEAQAGVATGKWMSPALVKAAIDVLAAKAQNILSDNTKSIFGLGSDAVPDNVFAKIGTFMADLSNAARIENGTYAGTGAIEKTITFQNPPKLVVVFDTNSKNNVSEGSRSLFFIGISGSDGGLFGYEGNPVRIQTISFSISGNKATINKGGVDSYSVNKKGRSYSYVAIG